MADPIDRAVQDHHHHRRYGVRQGLQQRSDVVQALAAGGADRDVTVRRASRSRPVHRAPARGEPPLMAIPQDGPEAGSSRPLDAAGPGAETRLASVTNLPSQVAVIHWVSL